MPVGPTGIPRFVINNSTGVSWPASGAGPGNGHIAGSVLSGTSGNYDPSSNVADLSADAPDLSSVPTDGTAVIAFETGGTYYRGQIVGVDNLLKTVDIWGYHFAEPPALTGVNWAIGGKLNSPEHPILAGGFTTQYAQPPVYEIEYTGTDYTLGAAIVVPSQSRAIWLGTGAQKPRLTSAAAGTRVFDFNGYGTHQLRNLSLVANGTAGTYLFDVTTRDAVYLEDCELSQAAYIFYGTNDIQNITLNRCHIHDLNEVRGQWASLTLHACLIEDCNTGLTNRQGRLMLADRCIVRNITGDALFMQGGSSGDPTIIVRNSAFYNVGHLCYIYNSGDTGGPLFENCVAWKINGYVFRWGYAWGGLPAVRRCKAFAWGSAASGRDQGDPAFTALDDPSQEIVLTADPFTNAAGGDFSLNNVAGGGAAIREVGWPTTWPASLPTTSYPDIGPVVRQATGGSSTVIIKRPRRIM